MRVPGRESSTESARCASSLTTNPSPGRSYWCALGDGKAWPRRPPRTFNPQTPSLKRSWDCRFHGLHFGHGTQMAPSTQKRRAPQRHVERGVANKRAMRLELTTLSLGIPPSDCAQPCPSGAKREVGNALRVIDPCPHGPPWARSCRWNGMKNGLYDPAQPTCTLGRLPRDVSDQVGQGKPA